MLDKLVGYLQKIDSVLIAGYFAFDSVHLFSVKTAITNTRTFRLFGGIVSFFIGSINGG